MEDTIHPHRSVFISPTFGLRTAENPTAGSVNLHWKGFEDCENDGWTCKKQYSNTGAERALPHGSWIRVSVPCSGGCHNIMQKNRNSDWGVNPNPARHIHQKQYWQKSLHFLIRCNGERVEHLATQKTNRSWNSPNPPAMRIRHFKHNRKQPWPK